MKDRSSPSCPRYPSQPKGSFLSDRLRSQEFYRWHYYLIPLNSITFVRKNSWHSVLNDLLGPGALELRECGCGFNTVTLVFCCLFQLLIFLLLLKMNDFRIRTWTRWPLWPAVTEDTQGEWAVLIKSCKIGKLSFLKWKNNWLQETGSSCETGCVTLDCLLNLWVSAFSSVKWFSNCLFDLSSRYGRKPFNLQMVRPW